MADGRGTVLRFTAVESEGKVVVEQVGERVDSDGDKLLVSPPQTFEDRSAFMSWLIQLIVQRFEAFPYLSIEPVKEEERRGSTDDYMFL